MKTSVAIVDNQALMAQALADLINCLDAYEVLFCAEDGQALLSKLDHSPVPDIVLLDVNRPVTNGHHTMMSLRERYPSIRVIVLSLLDDEQTVVAMMQQGTCGYLLKGCRPAELRQALDDVRDKGLYASAFTTSHLLRQLNRTGPAASFRATRRTPPSHLNDRERTFVKMACSELTYVEIADKMCVSPRTVDGYREAVFGKMQVKTRVGLVMEAIRLGWS